jgi:hypothetical protein
VQPEVIPSTKESFLDGYEDKRVSDVSEGFVDNLPVAAGAMAASYIGAPLVSDAVSHPQQSQVVHGNFLEVSSKDVNCHSHVISTNSLMPVMEQYMKVHEHDPTRSSIWQSNNGVPSYDTRDNLNVEFTDFPTTVSARLPAVAR